MDHWDPAVTDGFAQDRPVVLFDNAGVAGTTGDTPNTIEAMADHAVAFVGTLVLSQVDVLGFSIGGYVAQTLALRHRTLVRRMILVATGPRGGDPSQDPHAAEYAASTDPITGESSLDAFLYLFFPPTATSQAAGRAFCEYAADDGSSTSSGYWHGVPFQFPELFVAHGRMFLEGS